MRNQTAELMGFVAHYPHIPKAVDTLLRHLSPRKYGPSAYRNLVSQGTFVQKFDVIATYGDIQVTAPYAGKIEMLGLETPGVYEWPDLRSDDENVEFESDESYRFNLNYKALFFPDETDNRKAYAFGIRPEQVSSEEYLPLDVHLAYDKGQVWRNMKWRRGRTFYTIIDLVVCGSLKLPKPLRNNEEYRGELNRYWSLINNARATAHLLRSRESSLTDQHLDADQTVGQPFEPQHAQTKVEDETYFVRSGTDAQKAAMKLMNIEPPFTRPELVECYEQKRVGLAASELRSVKEAFKVLLPLAV